MAHGAWRMVHAWCMHEDHDSAWCMVCMVCTVYMVCMVMQWIMVMVTSSLYPTPNPNPHLDPNLLRTEPEPDFKPNSEP